jgi:hypothetical protein
MVVSFYAALGHTVTSKHAPRDSCFAPSTGCASAADEEAAESENRRSRALGDPFASVDAVALCAGHRQAGNSNWVAPKRVRIVSVLEEQGGELR